MKILWRLRTVSMFAVLTLILMGLGAIISVVFMNDWMIGLVIMSVISVLVNPYAKRDCAYSTIYLST